MATIPKAPTTDFTSTTLNGSINASTTSVTVNDASTIQTPTYAVIDRQDASGNNTPNSREVVYVSSKASNILTVTRGANNSTARSHNDSAKFEPVLSVGQWADLYTVITQEHNTDGTHGAITSTSATLTTPKIVTSINDSSGNEIIKTPATGSAVNEITVTNAATGNGPTISATGGDTDIPLFIKGKGTSGVQINDGNDNEALKFITTPSAVNELSITNAATGNAPSISATGGDTNISINLVPKGTGVVQSGGNTVPSVATAWTAFTPTITGSGGSVGAYAQDLVLARYTTIGKLVYFTIHVRITNKGSWSGNVQLAYPVTASTNLSDKAQIPVFLTAQSSNPVTATRGMGVSSSTTLINFKDSINTSVVQWAAVAVNDTIYGQGFYEID